MTAGRHGGDGGTVVAAREVVAPTSPRKSFERALAYQVCAVALALPGAAQLEETAALALRAAPESAGRLRQRLLKLATEADRSTPAAVSAAHEALFAGYGACAATDLELMSALARKEAWALAEDHRERAEASRATATSFLGDHHARWLAFAAELGAGSGSGYYRAASRVLDAWVRADAAALGVSG